MHSNAGPNSNTNHIRKTILQPAEMMVNKHLHHVDGAVYNVAPWVSSDADMRELPAVCFKHVQVQLRCAIGWLRGHQCKQEKPTNPNAMHIKDHKNKSRKKCTV